MARRPRSDPPLPNKFVFGLETGSPLGTNVVNAQVRDDRTPASSDRLYDALRTAQDDIRAVRILARLSPDASHAVWSMTRLADTPLTLTAYDPSGQVSPTGQAFLQALLNKLFNVSDYAKGYDTRASLKSLTQTLLRETVLCGAASLELVLDKARLPDYLQPVSPSTLNWRTTDVPVSAPSSPLAYKMVPSQTVQGKPVPLDLPTFFYQSLDQDPTTPYCTSVIETNLIPALQYENLITDVQRVVRMTGHSRLAIKLVFEKMKAAMPESIKSSPEKWEAWFEDQRVQVENVIRSRAPEQGFAMYDTAEASYINSDIGAGADYSPLLETFDGRSAASLKTPPSVLSKRMSAGSQNTSSTEATLYLQTAEALQIPTASILKQAFTLGLRLFGFEGYCEATFQKPSLRPDIELAAFRSMDTSTVLDLLSLGLITDEDAAQRLGTGPLPEGYVPLSGTHFRDAAPSSADALADPTSNADSTKRAVTGNLPSATPRKPQSSVLSG